MIVHVVMFTFKATPEKNEALAKTKKMLEALPSKIEGLLSMEVGIDFNGSARAMDLVLISTFATREDLTTYATHPAHLEVGRYISEVTELSRVVDYEK
ncbi:MAG: stress responsive protein [Sulfuricurvum sp. PC08-66]|nr:MAG: stress responsive protein [Sulfuricurvum sp. PC08-66]